MTSAQVIQLLKANQNQKGIDKWNRRTAKNVKLKSYGIGLTILRKLAKQIGRNRKLALELWDSTIYDARIIALLIDDPKQITIEQAEAQVEHVHQGHLAHVFSSCNASLAKTSFVADLIMKWINSGDTIRRRCGYGLLYELSKSKKKSTPDEIFFLDRIAQIRRTYYEENMIIQGAMGGALLGIGKRSVRLNSEALDLAKTIGPIEIPTDGKACEPFDVAKHLTSDYIRNKLGLTEKPLQKTSGL